MQFIYLFIIYLKAKLTYDFVVEEFLNKLSSNHDNEIQKICCISDNDIVITKNLR